MQLDLIDRIYECAVVPELWPEVLDDLADLTGSQGGLLFSARRALHWTSSPILHEVFDDYVTQGWFAQCRRRVCFAQHTRPSFVVEHDFWTDEELAKEPIYRDFFRPRGLGWSAGTALQIPTGDNIVFTVERRLEDGPVEQERVERLNALRPHLARSAFVSARLQLQRGHGAAETLAAMRLPAALLDKQGHVVESNAFIDEADIRQAVIWRAGDKLALADKRADRLLVDALDGIEEAMNMAARSFPVRDPLGKPLLVAHVMPVKRSAHDIFGHSFALLMLTPVAAQRVPSATLMKSLFDLTPSEARVAGGLAAGQTLDEIATEGDVAISTVRSQLRQVLQKTGCARQAEVAALLAAVSVGPDQDGSEGRAD